MHNYNRQLFVFLVFILSGMIVNELQAFEQYANNVAINQIEIMDDDGDGVPDADDDCPGSKSSIEVNWRGCSLDHDSDKDGVSDIEDICENTPAGNLVDIKGCKAVNVSNIQDDDNDGDGVPNTDDDCPGTASGIEVNWKGCSLNHDSDKDGVADIDDICETTLARSKVDTKGCAISFIGKNTVGSQNQTTKEKSPNKLFTGMQNNQLLYGVEINGIFQQLINQIYLVNGLKKRPFSSRNLFASYYFVPGPPDGRPTAILATPNTQPPPRKLQVSTLMPICWGMLSRNLLITPITGPGQPPRNALDCFQQVWKLDFGNQQVVRGLREIVRIKSNSSGS
jgi:hypothetical protein